MPRGSSIPYRPEVDSLRAIAVILVILFHARLGIFPGGFIGVDVFFVISGYLITSIIVRQMEAGTFNLWGFYASRGRRIIPPVFFMAIVVGLVCLVLPIYVGTSDFRLFKRTFISVILFCSNMYICRNTGGYFDMPADDQVFLHTWSLSVEAQFYLFYPFFVMFVQRHWPWKKELALRFLTFFCFTVAIICVSIKPTASFYYFPTRSWELLLGGYVAVSKITPQSQCWKRACTLAGLAMIIASALIFNRFFEPAFPGAWALWPCLGAAMCIAGTIDYGHDDLLWAIATNRALIFTGLISYSLYLWHWPILVIYRQMTLGQEIALLHFVGLCTIIYALALLSYKCIEQPIRHGFSKVAITKQITTFAICALALITLAVVVRAPLDFFLSGYAQDAKVSYFEDTSKHDIVHYIGNVQSGDSIKFALIGDSHSEVMFDMFDGLGKQNNILGYSFHSRKYPMLLNGYWLASCDNWRDSENTLKMAIIKNKAENIFIATRWSWLIHGTLPQEGYSKKNKFYYDNSQIRLQGAEAVEASLRETLNFLANNGTKNVYLFLPIPENHFKISNKANFVLAVMGRSESWINAHLGVTMADYEIRNKDALIILHRMADEFDCVTLIDPTKVLCPDGEHCLVVENGRSLYYDDDHLSRFGAMKLAPLVRTAAPELFGDVH